MKIAALFFEENPIHRASQRKKGAGRKYLRPNIIFRVGDLANLELLNNLFGIAYKVGCNNLQAITSSL